MKKMQEKDFEEIDRTCFGNCQHDVVKLYDNATHVDYGCTKCKFRHADKSEFDNSQDEALIRKFKMEYATYDSVDETLLIHRGYSKQEIQLLIDTGCITKMDGYASDSAFANEIRYKVKI